MYLIPVFPKPNQAFTCTIPVNEENIDFRFSLWYNEVAKYWLLSATRIKDDKELFVNLPLVASQYGFWNNLKQLEYLQIGSMYVTITAEDDKSMPDDKNLGKAYVMLWGDNE